MIIVINGDMSVIQLWNMDWDWCFIIVTFKVFKKERTKMD